MITEFLIKKRISTNSVDKLKYSKPEKIFSCGIKRLVWIHLRVYTFESPKGGSSKLLKIYLKLICHK